MLRLASCCAVLCCVVLCSFTPWGFQRVFFYIISFLPRVCVCVCVLVFLLVFLSPWNADFWCIATKAGGDAKSEAVKILPPGGSEVRTKIKSRQEYCCALMNSQNIYLICTPEYWTNIDVTKNTSCISRNIKKHMYLVFGHISPRPHSVRPGLMGDGGGGSPNMGCDCFYCSWSSKNESEPAPKLSLTSCHKHAHPGHTTPFNSYEPPETYSMYQHGIGLIFQC